MSASEEASRPTESAGNFIIKKMASPPSPKAPSGLLKAFAFYGAYHSDPINQRIHQVFVPAIYTTALVFLTRASTGITASSLPSLFTPVLKALGEGKGGGGSISAGLPVALGYAAYYWSLTVVERPLLGLSASALALGALPLAHAWMGNLGPHAMTGAIVVHVMSWVAQFYGHGVHEGRSPALLDNLFQALVMAPLFVFIETLMGMGLLGDFKASVDPIIEKALEDFRSSKRK